MIRNYKYYLILILSVFAVNVYAQKPLNQYLKTAAENNPNIQASFNEYMSVLEKIPQVGTLPDPTIAFAYFIEPIETRLGPQQAKISVSQMFPWFGTLSTKEKSMEMLAKSKYELFEGVKSKLFYDVKSAYYELFFLKHSISISKDNIDLLESTIKLADINVTLDRGSTIDLYTLKIEINELNYQLSLLKDRLSVLKIKFNKLLNKDALASIDIASKLDIDMLFSKEQLLDSIMTHNNSLSHFDYLLQGLDYQKIVSKKEGMPQFSLGVDYAFIGDNSMSYNSGKDAIIFPKLGMSIPLYRGKYRAKVREIVYKRKATEYKKEDEKNKIRVLFEDVWKDYVDANRRVELYNMQLGLVNQSLSVLLSEYSTGKGDFEELLRMEQKLLKYSIQIPKAESDKSTAWAFILYLQGK